MNENKKAPQNRIEVMEEIVQKLEWSKLVYRGPNELQIFCCPLCGGAEPKEYDFLDLEGQDRYQRGHYLNCKYISYDEKFEL